MPRFVKVCEFLDGRALGQLTSITYRFATPTPANADPAHNAWRVSAANAGGGLLLDVGSHVLDFLDHCVGPLEDVQGRAARLATTADVEDAVALTFRTATGALGAASWNFATTAKEDTLEFLGTAGRISFNVFNAEPIRLETARGVESFAIPNPEHVAQPLIQLAVDELLGRGTCPSTGESARRTTVVMDRILDAYYGGRSDEFWLRPATWPGRA